MLTKTNNEQLIMTNRTYDWSKKLVQIWLPASSALYFGLGQMWGFPYLDKIPGSIALVNVFLGLVLNVSHNRYKESDAAVDGDIVVTQNGERTVATLEFNDDATTLVKNKTIKFKVKEGRPTRDHPLTVEDIDDEDP